MVQISDFPAFQSPEYGFHVLNDAEKPSALNEILNFQRLVPFQPFFYVSRESWENLAYGKGIDLRDPYTQTPLKVYGFVFCFATMNNDFKWSMKYGCKYPHLLNKLGFFRIRTLLIKEGEDVTKDKINVFVETEAIAYADVSIALHNHFHSSREPEDCIVFVTNSREARNIDSMVWNKKDPDAIRRLPDSFVSTMGYPPFQSAYIAENGGPLKNEGCIFGIQNIWENLLKTKYPKIKGTLVSLALIENKNGFGQLEPRDIYFNVKINCEGKLNVPCPNPPACHSSS